MRKSFIFTLIAIIAAVSCDKQAIEIIPEESQTPKEVVFQLDAKHPDSATRAVKTGWETGDVVFVFFSGATAPAYLEMKWDGAKWVLTTKNDLTLSEGQTGTMTAVYLPFGSGATISDDSGSYKFGLSKVYCSYYLTAQLPYTVTDNTVSGSFQMKIPEGYVQFFIDASSAASSDVVELREPNLTPVKVLSVGADGAIATETLAHGAPMPGYVYDKENKADGESKGYLFSGILAEEARATATDYHFTFVKGSSYYSKTYSAKSFYRGDSEGRAIKLPVVGSWNAMTGDLPIDLNVDVDGRRVYWSSRNLGAINKEDSGDYFAFGETETYYETLSPLVWKDGKSAGYAEDSYTLSLKDKYSSYGNLDSTDDAASVHLEGLWRTPTASEYDALTNSCYMTWVPSGTQSVEGSFVTGPGYKITSKVKAKNWILLPAAGYYSGTAKNTSYSFYWTAVASNRARAYYFVFNSSTKFTSMNGERSLGCMIRPVMN